MNDMLNVLATNFLGFDMAIFILAVINAACFAVAWKKTGALHGLLNLTVMVPVADSAKEAAKRAGSVREDDVMLMRKRAGTWYELFSTLTSIFPLMGILGTVISLLPMVSALADIEGNFFAALTSTLWGLVFAIIFKVLDGFLGARVDDNEKNAALFLERRRSLK